MRQAYDRDPLRRTVRSSGECLERGSVPDSHKSTVRRNQVFPLMDVQRRGSQWRISLERAVAWVAWRCSFCHRIRSVRRVEPHRRNIGRMEPLNSERMEAAE
jgi:hypothetical protein